MGAIATVYTSLRRSENGHAIMRAARKVKDRSRLSRHSADCRLQKRMKGPPMSENPVLWSLDERGVATVTLNRPEVNNAYDGGLIGGVLSAMDELGKGPSLRIVVLRGNG